MTRTRMYDETDIERFIIFRHDSETIDLKTKDMFYFLIIFSVIFVIFVIFVNILLYADLKF